MLLPDARTEQFDRMLRRQQPRAQVADPGSVERMRGEMADRLHLESLFVQHVREAIRLEAGRSEAAYVVFDLPANAEPASFSLAVGPVATDRVTWRLPRTVVGPALG